MGLASNLTVRYLAIKPSIPHKIDGGNNEISNWNAYLSGCSLEDVNCFFYPLYLLVIYIKLSWPLDNISFDSLSSQWQLGHQTSEINTLTK